MMHKNARKYGSVFGVLFVGIVIVALAAGAALPAAAQSLKAKTSRATYHDQWRKLWEDHITWTRVVILGILDELPGTSVYTDRLLDNYEDMEDALRPYYGDEAEVFGDLIQDHLVIAAELLTAAHDGDTAAFNDALARWYANAHDLAVQMNKMNPKNWPLEETEMMWTDHLDATLLEATDNLTGDYAGEVAAYDQVHDMALEMADFISNGVMRQFPGKFKAPVK